MKTIIFTITLIFLNICASFSQYKVEWAAYHSSEGTYSLDKANLIASDPMGNIVVCGITNGNGLNDDITTIKYDKTGKQLWIAVYNGTGNYHDRPFGLVIDGFGNVYITGSSKGDGGTATDLITLKYNTNGSEMWAVRYASKGGLLDESRSIAVDQIGNVYVTGAGAHLVTDNSGQDWITIKYNSSGQQIWIIAYDDGITSDGAKALTIDGVGNVYVTGQCNGPGYHIATIKYDSSGVKQWITKYNGSGNSSDEPMDILVDKLGYIYVTGHSFESNNDFITIIYDNNGNELWKRNFNGLINMNDEAEQLLVDDNGNVYVLGYSTVKKKNKNRCLVKYDNSGAEKWNVLSEQSITLTDQTTPGLSMAFDKDFNIITTGSSSLINNKSVSHFVIDCYSSDGNLLWQKYFSGPENTIPTASAIVFDKNDNIYVTGFIAGSRGIYDYCTVKFSK